MPVEISRDEAIATFTRALETAGSEVDLPREWLDRAGGVGALGSTTYTPVYGTALLARASDERVDATLLTEEAGDGGYGARQLARVFMEQAERHGLDMRVGGTDPLANQPFLAEPVVHRGLRARSPEDLDYLCDSLEAANTLDSSAAEHALAALLRVRREATPNFTADIITPVLELQSDYSSDTPLTEAMRARRGLVERDGPRLLRRLVGGLELSLAVEGSGGVGKPARVPWIRIFDKERSPSATAGWYVVFLFSYDGSAAFLSLNQGTQEIDGNSLVGRSLELIAQRTIWARSQLRGKGLDDFDTAMSLRDVGNKGGAYERGSVCSRRYAHGDSISDGEIVADISALAAMLHELYDHDGAAPTTVRDDEDAAETDRSALAIGPEQSGLDLAWLESATLLSDYELDEILYTLRNRTPQVVFSGPPGTSKTWVAKCIARHLTDGRSGAVRTVQFHPSYGYEDFVEGLRPQAGAGGLEFRPVAGSLIEASEIARTVDHPVVLIIDEMNRANIPRVFGEMMYLLEYRDDPIDLLYRREFSLPSNLLIIATMNTADASIRNLDAALRRRFDVFDFPPRPEHLDRFYGDVPLPGLADGLRNLNSKLESELDRHHTIGHAFLMKREMTATELYRIWSRQIFPQIEEYFFDAPDALDEFELERFWDLRAWDAG